MIRVSLDQPRASDYLRKRLFDPNPQACSGQEGVAMLPLRRSRALVIYLTLLPGLSALGDAPKTEEKPVRTDLYGDPLPAGVIARLGTVRLRHGSVIRYVAFTADSKALISAGENGVIRLWETA